MAVGFFYSGAVVLLWLMIFTVISYVAPDSLPGRVFGIVK